MILPHCLSVIIICPLNYLHQSCIFWFLKQSPRVEEHSKVRRKMLTTLSRDLTNWVDQQNTGFKPRCILASFDIVYQLIFFSTLGDTLCRCFMIAWLAALKLQPPVSALMLHVRSKKYRKHFFMSWWQGLGYLIPFICTVVRSLTFSWWLQPCQQWSDQLVYIYRLFMLRTVYSLSDLNP